MPKIGYKLKTHINYDWTSNSLCGRKNVDFNAAWLNMVDKYLKSYPKTVWCTDM